MRRDMDLVRAILIAVEAHPDGFAPSEIAIEGYSPEQIGYHATIMSEAGLVEAEVDGTIGGSGPMARIDRLTWAGHQFLDASRSPDIWSQAKSFIAKTGGASLEVWQSVLTDLVKKSLGVG